MGVCWPAQPQRQDSAAVTTANVGLRPDIFAVGTSASGRSRSFGGTRPLPGTRIGVQQPLRRTKADVPRRPPGDVLARDFLTGAIDLLTPGPEHIAWPGLPARNILTAQGRRVSLWKPGLAPGFVFAPHRNRERQVVGAVAVATTPNPQGLTFSPNSYGPRPAGPADSCADSCNRR